jgi:hypothetical protein
LGVSICALTLLTFTFRAPITYFPSYVSDADAEVLHSCRLGRQLEPRERRP